MVATIVDHVPKNLGLLEWGRILAARSYIISHGLLGPGVSGGPQRSWGLQKRWLRRISGTIDVRDTCVLTYSLEIVVNLERVWQT